MNTLTVKPGYIEKHKGNHPVFVNNEQNTYGLCPWGGTATLIQTDGKHDLYLTDNFNHKKEFGLYIVIN